MTIVRPRARHGLVVLAVTLVGCSIPDKHPSSSGTDGGGGDATAGTDSATGPLRCLGQPLPTTAPAQITLTVQTVNVTTAQPLPNVTLSGVTSSPQMTDASGTATLTVSTDMKPVDSFITASGGSAGFMTADLHPSRPYDHDQQLTVPMISYSDMAALAGAAGTVYDTQQAQLMITVVDCDGNPMSGAKVLTADPVVYAISGSPAPSATATDASGIAYVFGVATNMFTVAAKASTGAMLRGQSVATPANDWVVIAIQP